MDPSLAQIERYRVIEEVGRGGMAVVYRGRDRTLDREVAVKVLHAHLADSPESRARFQREAQAVAKLRHPNIIEIYDYADAVDGAGPSYIVTEFIAGQTLKQFMDERTPFFPEAAVMIGIEICQAIGHAHGLGIIHRDLKPENMMINAAGRLKLMDFGIAKLIDQQQQMTVTGSILGSPAHMAPEMLEGKELDVRSDLFSLGTILYWLATGQLPFVGKNPHHVLRRILEGDYPDPQQINPECSASLCRLIRRCLATRPEDRFPSAIELERALRAELDDLDLGEPPEFLHGFFADPEATLAALRPQVASMLLARGRRRMKEKKHRQSLEDLDRLLAMEPGHAEALALVSGLERRKQWARRFVWSFAAAAVLICVSIAAWAAFSLWPDRSVADGGLADAGLAAIGPAPGAEEALADSDGGPSAPADGAAGQAPEAPDAGPSAADARSVDPDGSAGGDRLRVASRPPLIRKTDPRLPPPVVRPAVEHEVEIRSDPYFQELLIDGKLVARADKSNAYGQKFRSALPAGKHRVLLRNPACQDEEADLVVPAEPDSEADLQFGFRLDYKPATLVIESEVPDASVWVDGKFKGTASQSRAAPITIPIEGKRPGREVDLRLSHAQHGELKARVRVSAGRQSVHRVTRSAFVPAGRDGGGP